MKLTKTLLTTALFTLSPAILGVNMNNSTSKNNFNIDLPTPLETIPDSSNSYQAVPTPEQITNQRKAILGDYSADPITNTNIWANMGGRSADSYMQALSNMRKNDPRAARKQALYEANERAKQTQQWNDDEIARLEALGATPQEIDMQKRFQADLANMSPQERLQNYDARRNGDFDNTYDDAEFANVLENSSFAEIKARFGQEVADYAFQKVQKYNSRGKR